MSWEKVARACAVGANSSCRIAVVRAAISPSLSARIALRNIFVVALFECVELIWARALREPPALL